MSPECSKYAAGQGTILIALPSHASRSWMTAWLCKQVLPDWEQTRGHQRGIVPRPVWDLDMFLAKVNTPTRTRVINLYWSWIRLSVFLISFTSSIVSTLRSVDQASLWKMMMTEFLGIAMNCSDRYILASAPHRTQSMLLKHKTLRSC